MHHAHLGQFENMRLWLQERALSLRAMLAKKAHVTGVRCSPNGRWWRGAGWGRAGTMPVCTTIMQDFRQMAGTATTVDKNEVSSQSDAKARS